MNPRPLFEVLVSAALFGLSAPLSKLLLRDVDALVLTGLLYLGAFLGLFLFSTLPRFLRPAKRVASSPFTRQDFPWLAGAVLFGGIIGTIALFLGLRRMSGFSATLLLNLEGVMTGLIAVFFFREQAGRRLWLALAAMTGAGVFLTWNPVTESFAWSGALFILLAMAAWGADNNFTRAIAHKNAVHITQVKGLATGLFSLTLALALGRPLPGWKTTAAGLVLGALSYGLSLVLYIRAQAGLGAFRAGAFFSVGPFVGAAAAIPILAEAPRWSMLPGALLMAVGVAAIMRESHGHDHRHEPLEHSHLHGHADAHHDHGHAGPVGRPHEHPHTHAEMDHSHPHWPDIHHRHGH